MMLVCKRGVSRLAWVAQSHSRWPGHRWMVHISCPRCRVHAGLWHVLSLLPLLHLPRLLLLLLLSQLYLVMHGRYAATFVLAPLKLLVLTHCAACAVTSSAASVAFCGACTAMPAHVLGGCAASGDSRWASGEAVAGS